MRMRKKKNLHPRMEACGDCWIRRPEDLRGHWRELYPQANILALDYDPDTSFANVENRLQMLIMEAQRKG